MARRQDLPSLRRTSPRRHRVRLLRRTPLRQRPPPLRPPVDGRGQGHRPALPDDAWSPRRAAIRMGLPWSSSRDGGREGARCARARRHHRVRDRPLQRPLSIHRPAHDRLVGVVRRTSGSLGRFRQRLQDDGPVVHGERPLGVPPALRQGPRLRGVPGTPLLLGVRDTALQLRDTHGRQHPRPHRPCGDRAVRHRPSRAHHIFC